MRDRFLFYGSFWEALSDLTDEQKGQCLTALSEYALYGKEPSFENPIVKLFFTMARPQIDANNQRFENGSKGGAPKKTEKEPNNNQTITKEKPKNNQTETETEGNKKEKEKYNNNTPPNNNKLLLSPPRVRKQFPEEFEEWWKLCPKKVDKDKSFRKFNTIVAGKLATVEELTEGMRKYSQKCIRENTEDHFIKHPSTWLNSGCWKDEYTTWKTLDVKPNSYEIFNQAMDEVERRVTQ